MDSIRRDRQREEFVRETLPHLPYLFRLASSLTHHREDAEDLVQETLVRALRFHRRFEPGTNLRAWLSRILKNSFINTRREAARDRRVLDPVMLDAEVPEGGALREPAADSPAPDEMVIRLGLAERVAEVMPELPGPYRDALALHLQDLSYREISESLRVPLGTVMSRLHRARSLLRQRLYPEPSRAHPALG